MRKNDLTAFVGPSEIELYPNFGFHDVSNWWKKDKFMPLDVLNNFGGSINKISFRIRCIVHCKIVLFPDLRESFGLFDGWTFGPDWH